MKVLLSAFECNPKYGSDPYVGWSWVYNMAKMNEVYVLLRIDHKPYIEDYFSNHLYEYEKKIHFIYIDSSKFFGKIVYRFNKQFAVVGQYFMWQKKAYKVAKKMHKNINFDIVHVVSIADYRFPGYLWKLNIPYIFGPVGGAQETPQCLLEYICGNMMNEKFRTLMNRLLVRLPNYHFAINNAKIIFCSNDETEKAIKKNIKPTELYKVKRLTELGINDSYLYERRNIEHLSSDEVHILVSGRLMYRKGIALLIDAVYKVSAQKRFVVDIYGDGEQKDELLKKVKMLNLEDKVKFHGNIPFSVMQQKYIEADIYCLPSLRETTGTAVFEAMANKLPVIALKQNGVKDIVSEQCGILVEIKTKEQVIADFAKALEVLIDNDFSRVKMGEQAYKTIVENYTWTRRIEKMNKVYEELMSGANNYGR